MTREWTPKRRDGTPLEPREVPGYIRDIAGALADLATQHNLRELACFLDTAAAMADDEAGPDEATTPLSAPRPGPYRDS